MPRKKEKIGSEFAKEIYQKGAKEARTMKGLAQVVLGLMVSNLLRWKSI
jgi:hypothetical protein